MQIFLRLSVLLAGVARGVRPLAVYNGDRKDGENAGRIMGEYKVRSPFMEHHQAVRRDAEEEEEEEEEVEEDTMCSDITERTSR